MDRGAEDCGFRCNLRSSIQWNCELCLKLANANDASLHIPSGSMLGHIAGGGIFERIPCRWLHAVAMRKRCRQRHAFAGWCGYRICLPSKLRYAHRREHRCLGHRYAPLSAQWSRQRPGRRRRTASQGVLARSEEAARHGLQRANPPPESAGRFGDDRVSANRGIDAGWRCAQNRYMTNAPYIRCVLSVVTGLSAASPCSFP
jgi:hypothetical protein